MALNMFLTTLNQDSKKEFGLVFKQLENIFLCSLRGQRYKMLSKQSLKQIKAQWFADYNERTNTGSPCLPILS